MVTEKDLCGLLKFRSANNNEGPRYKALRDSLPEGVLFVHGDAAASNPSRGYHAYRAVFYFPIDTEVVTVQSTLSMARTVLGVNMMWVGTAQRQDERELMFTIDYGYDSGD